MGRTIIIIWHEDSTSDEVDNTASKNFSNQSKSFDTADSYLSREEVAAMCKIKSLSTLWAWKEKNLLVPTSRAGRKPLYLKKDVLAFLEGKRGGTDV